MRGKYTQAGAGFNTQWLILLQSVKTHLASWNCDGFPHPDGIKTCRRKAKELSKHENNSSLRDTTAGKQTRTAPAEKGIHLHRCVTSFPQCFILPQFSGARSKTTLHKALYLDLFQKSSPPKEQSPLTFFLLFGCLGFFLDFFLNKKLLYRCTKFTVCIGKQKFSSRSQIPKVGVLAFRPYSLPQV